MVAVPDLAAVKAYLGQTSYSDADIQDELDSETALQTSACGDRSAAYSAPLAEALKRRVARALAMRPVLMGLTTTPEGGSERVARLDNEIRRKEAPYRRLAVG